jgi:uncharacterized protein with HEPN domain
MSKRDWTLFLQDMLESIENIAQYTSGMGFQDFLKDTRTRDAVVRNLEVLGEAARKLPSGIRERYPEIPWTQIVGLRNRLIHGYFLVDYGIVWEIVQDELPQLRKRLEQIMREVSE